MALFAVGYFTNWWQTQQREAAFADQVKRDDAAAIQQAARDKAAADQQTARDKAAQDFQVALTQEAKRQQKERDDQAHQQQLDLANQAYRQQKERDEALKQLQLDLAQQAHQQQVELAKLAYSQQKERDEAAHRQQMELAEQSARAQAERDKATQAWMAKSEKRSRIFDAFKTLFKAAEAYRTVTLELRVVREGDGTPEARNQRLAAVLKEVQEGVNDALIALALDVVSPNVENLFLELRKAFFDYSESLRYNTELGRAEFPQEHIDNAQHRVEKAADELLVAMRAHLKELETPD